MTTPTRYRRKPKVIDVLVWPGDNLDDVMAPSDETRPCRLHR